MYLVLWPIIEEGAYLLTYFHIISSIKNDYVGIC